ncbi:MAG: DUF302 domain-containing protein [Magnetococcales bacterium]|nr:DUF302 domain-containing protein [Magnetococcales bacterium]MBF0155858.1 DUF302 domain-containing protein [Magnetococcales bacterium]
MSDTHSTYALVQPVAGEFSQVVELVRQALAAQGFGILTEIDVSTTLKKKLGVDHPRTLILGACNPPLAHKALVAAPDISVLLPCNVVVREGEGGVEVAAIAPMTMATMISDKAVDEVATEADRRIRAALATLPSRG